MKKLLLTCGALALLSGVPAHALAETSTPGQAPNGALIAQPTFSFNAPTTSDPITVEVDFGPTSLFAIATLDKDVVTDELITFNTYVELDQTVDATNTTDFAESSAMGVQTNTDNKDCSNCAEKTDTIGGSGQGQGSADNNTGLVSINQAAGNNNNQGTLVSAAVDSATHGNTPPTTTSPPTPVTPTSVGGGVGFAHAQAEATQFNGLVPLTESAGNTVETVDLIYRNANILNSFDNNTGLIYGNQSTGNNNNQLNELSLAFAEQPQGVAIAETDLGQFNTDNTVGESASTGGGSTGGGSIGINKQATVNASLNSNTGVFGVNQSVGNNGNQANIVSVAAVGTNLPTFH